MKRLMIAIAAAALIPGAAMANANNLHRDAHNVRVDRQNVRHDRAAVQHDRAQLRHDVRVGTRLVPARYASRYTIAYPQRYRLARAGYSQRWVRMNHDAVLVDLRTGRVISVGYGRFG